MIYARIAGTGSYLPEQVLTNAEIAQRLDTSDEWIVSRTGIRARHIAAPEQKTSDLALIASQRALEAAGVQAADIDLIVVATSTPDMIFPSSACILQAKLGAHGCPAFDVQAVCAGFIYALATANAYIRSGMARTALVVGAEIFSRILDWNDRTTCVLFGDGAGAVVLEARDVAEDGPGLLATRLHADGAHNELLYVDGGPSSTGTVGHVRMKGREVFRHAVTNLAEVLGAVLAEVGLTSAEIDWVVPHQANQRILDATAKKLGLAPERVVVTVDRHANTSAASVPLALDTAMRDGRIQPGQLIVLEAMGGGFTWGAALLRV